MNVPDELFELAKLGRVYLSKTVGSFSAGTQVRILPPPSGYASAYISERNRNTGAMERRWVDFPVSEDDLVVRRSRTRD